MYIMSLKAEPTTQGALRASGLKERPVDQERGEEAGREKWTARTAPGKTGEGPRSPWKDITIIRETQIKKHSEIPLHTS